MLKKTGLSAVALLAMLACVQPASLFAGDRDDHRYDNHYTSPHNARDERQSHARMEKIRRDRHGRNDRDRDRDWRKYRDNDDWYGYNSFRR